MIVVFYAKVAVEAVLHVVSFEGKAAEALVVSDVLFDLLFARLSSDVPRIAEGYEYNAHDGHKEHPPEDRVHKSLGVVTGSEVERKRSDH